MESIYSLFFELGSLGAGLAIIIILVLIISDIFFIGSTALITLSLSLIPYIILNLLEFNVVIQVWSLPISLIILILFNRYIFNGNKQELNPYENKSLVGEVGFVEIKQLDNSAENHFYRYKNDINYEIDSVSEVHFTYFIKFENGTKSPILNSDKLNFNDHDKVVVTDEINGGVMVRYVGENHNV